MLPAVTMSSFVNSTFKHLFFSENVIVLLICFPKPKEGIKMHLVSLSNILLYIEDKNFGCENNWTLKILYLDRDPKLRKH